MTPPLLLLLAIPVLYPALFIAFGERVPFGNHADLNYIWGVISHLLKADWAHLFELPVFQPLPGMLASGHPLLGLYPFFKLFQILGFDLAQSHTLYLISALYLNALGHFLLLRRLNLSRVIALALSLFTLVWGLNAVHFIWLNFLSLFWLPFCLFFLLRWYSRPAWSDGVMAAVCGFMLFSACEYYGIHFFLFLFPPLLAVLLYTHRQRIRSWLSLLLPFAALAPLTLALYWPLLERGQQIKALAGFDPGHLIGAGDVFCYSHLLHRFFPEAVITGHSLYLGVGLAMLLFIFFSASLAEFRLVWSLLMLLYLTAIPVFFMSPMWLEWITFLLLAGLGLLLILKLKEKGDLWGRFSALVSAAFLLLLWGMPHIDPDARSSVYRLLWEHLPGFKGLRAYDRVFPLLLPFLLIMAARGVQKLSETGLKRRAVHTVLAAAVLLMIGEHYYRGQFAHLTHLPRRPDLFLSVPEQDRGTLLALPLFRGEYGEVQNARHMVNLSLHNLSLIGGRTTYPPDGYFTDLHELVDHGRLNGRTLRRLIDDHALAYLVIHWDWLAEYYGADSTIPDEIRFVTKDLEDWLQPLHESGAASLFRVVDNEVQTVFIRSYARGQLLGSRIRVKIIDSDPEWLEWSVADEFPRRLAIRGQREIDIDPGRIPDRMEIVLKIRCDRAARLDIRVVR